MTSPNIVENKQSDTARTPNVESTDARLVSMVCAGRSAAFELIMRRYNQRLFRLARSIVRQEDEAMDVVQESYVKAYFQLKKCRDPNKLGAWLSRIASNEAVARLRKGSRLDYVAEEVEMPEIGIINSEPQPLDKVANRQLRKLLEQAIDQLALNYRSVYVLRAIEQLDTRETAESLALSEDVVKTRYRRAKKMLRDIFQRHLDKANLSAHEFAGYRCDTIVERLRKRLKI